MKIIKSNFLVSITKYDTKKNKLVLPEFAFAGKSNVGKSSLINKLTNRKKLSYVSKKPGKTRTINFFLINDAFYFVDLPGYGYSKVSGELKQLWHKSISEYLIVSENLMTLFILIDIRRLPDEKDIKLFEFCQFHQINYKVILTKCDKFSKSKVNSILNKYDAMYGSDNEPIAFSSVTGEGKNGVLTYINKFLGGV